MGAICNGLALDGSGLMLIATVLYGLYASSDSALSLSEAGVIYIMTHDSIALGGWPPPAG